MKIGIEIGWSQKAGGARRVAFNTLAEMCKLRSNYQFHTFTNENIDVCDSSNLKPTVLRAPFAVPQTIWDQFLFPHVAVPYEVSKLKLDVVHFTNNIVPIVCKTPYVVTIHDMTPFVIPDSFKKFHGSYQRWYFKLAAKNARKIITVSQNSKNDICRLLDVNDDKVVVVPLAPLESPSVGNQDDSDNPEFLDSPYLLYVGAIHPRKNVIRLIKAFGLLKKNKNIPHKLMIAGALRWGNDEISSEIDKLQLNDDVQFLGRVSDELLNKLYKNCSAFVYPSIYEGFGLPVIEAMSQGAPVITSIGSSLEEVAGDAAELIDPYSEEDIARGLEKVLLDTTYADNLRQKGIQRAKEFTWEKTAKGILDVLESV
ncbi:glycosyltransferase family 1 protein [Paraglaciecola sp.]|uniref:glycosyltransferase family 4 protein n=1 Tax=Paraglaciecola sp. TaxID=1920173 RepID=UPI00273D7D3B|nr:glycosyltransferase family 1 protein [Paraglaciecola sp.]MDP5029820.1 glycosyltransferase family 4 protein [Paraglaciecola sp.]